MTVSPSRLPMTWHKPRYKDHVTLEEINLAIAILHSTPRLDGAACAGRHELFDLAAVSRGPGGHTDDNTRYAQEAAQRICEGCSALGGCRAFYAALRAQDGPFGVVAGRLRQTPSAAEMT